MDNILTADDKTKRYTIRKITQLIDRFPNATIAERTIVDTVYNILQNTKDFLVAKELSEQTRDTPIFNKGEFESEEDRKVYEIKREILKAKYSDQDNLYEPSEFSLTPEQYAEYNTRNTTEYKNVPDEEERKLILESNRGLYGLLTKGLEEQHKADIKRIENDDEEVEDDLIDVPDKINELIEDANKPLKEATEIVSTYKIEEYVEPSPKTPRLTKKKKKKKAAK